MQPNIDAVSTMQYHTANSAQVPAVGCQHDQYSGHTDEHRSGHVPAEEYGIPNYEDADDFHIVNNSDAFRPCEYQEPPLLALPPIGLRIPHTVALVKPVPLCWDWPATKSTDVRLRGPVRTDAPPQADNGLFAATASAWGNPRVAADHAKCASQAAVAFMAWLRLQQPLADNARDSEVPTSQVAVTVAHSSVDADVHGPDDAPGVDTRDAIVLPAGDGPSDSAPEAAAVTVPVSVHKPAREPEEKEAAAPATPLQPRSEAPAAETTVIASNGMHAAVTAHVDNAEGLVQPAQPMAASSPKRNNAAAEMTQMRGEAVGVRASTGISGQPDSPGDRNPPHPAERSEDAAMLCRVGASVPTHRSDSVLCVPHWWVTSHQLL